MAENEAGNMESGNGFEVQAPKTCRSCGTRRKY